MDNLIEGAERAGVDEQREVLDASYVAIFGDPVSKWDHEEFGEITGITGHYACFIAMLDAEAYLSAAEMLVPEGCFWGVIVDGDGDGFQACCEPGGTSLLWYKATTPALALAAAALRARKEQA